MKKLSTGATSLLAAVCALNTTMVLADSARSQLIEEVVVSAMKKNVAEDIQSIPLAVTAFGESQIEALKLKDISDIGLMVPNVNLQPASFQGTAFFGIRGAAAVSTVMSVDPSVGVLVDGVYQPTSRGIVLDLFDLESIEILRGPQGVLFGRNVVGGAVLVNSKKPTDEFEAEVGLRVGSGFRGTGEDATFTGVVTGPLTDNINGKLAVYQNDDDGWFENEFNGENFGKNETSIVRGALSYNVNDDVNLLVQYEHYDQDGDGLVNQSHDRSGLSGPRPDGSPGQFKKGSHDVATEMDSYAKTKSDSITFTTTVDVDFGNGTITNIFGWRDLEQSSETDLDGTDIATYPAAVGAEFEFWSNELRYFGTFDRIDLTAGLYYLDTEMNIEEQSALRIASTTWLNRTAGGFQDSQTLGVFSNIDYRMTNALTLSAGLRYTKEDKDFSGFAAMANRTMGPRGYVTCGYVIGDSTCPIDFEDDKSWSNVSFRFGATWELDDMAMLYSSISRSYRAGGYNARRTNPSDGLRPVDEERVDQLELGAKLDISDSFRLNSAIFMLETKDLQRTTFEGLAQFTGNVASSRVFGVELEGRVLMGESLAATFGVGLMQSEYTEVLTDLNGDDVIDMLDYSLDLPGTPDYNYNLGLVHDMQIGDFGYLSSQIMVTHREQKVNSSNTHITPEVDLVDINFALLPNDAPWKLSLYGKNLTNEAIYTQSTDIPLGDGAHWAGIMPGRRYGLEFKYTF